MLAIKLQQDEENHHRCQMELEEEKRLWVPQKVEEENQQRKRESQIAVEYERLQSQLSEDLRRQVVSEYQRRFQEIQLNTRKGPIEETQKSFQLSPRATREESHETPAQPEPTVCWKCGEAGHRRKIAWQSCSVQTVAETTILPVNVDKCLKKIACIANEMTTPKSVVQ